MSVTIRYFARLREILGTSKEQLPFVETWATVQDVRRALAARGEPWEALLATDIQSARNGELASNDTPVADGDEIAFFPPVTGG